MAEGSRIPEDILVNLVKRSPHADGPTIGQGRPEVPPTEAELFAATHPSVDYGPTGTVASYIAGLVPLAKFSGAARVWKPLRDLVKAVRFDEIANSGGQIPSMNQLSTGEKFWVFRLMNMRAKAKDATMLKAQRSKASRLWEKLDPQQKKEIVRYGRERAESMVKERAQPPRADTGPPSLPDFSEGSPNPWRGSPPFSQRDFEHRPETTIHEGVDWGNMIREEQYGRYPGDAVEGRFRDPQSARKFYNDLAVKRGETTRGGPEDMHVQEVTTPQGTKFWDVVLP